ncbi:helix-turn-helix transcriptional regulator [Enterobacter kobei]|jgi:phage repressor protein C with HTH and peptisase S24 domain|uniref:LexA family transcriptional regulator n=1 Tax=Enterobacter cloacae complex TaxID=354276 RepID=UPI000643DC10|nr:MULTISPECIES: S24 family peptidase [Enterobacter cloacae complex]EKV4056811.1 helix-turn-helix transcriptional regulator [Enterobacter hormaechei]HBM2851203.1 helix-turn-helix transcriptional regulator [Enterobacter hormaechei subsp. xiangfangensis]HDW0150885.1 helix-turn-helix transcriptional regulator [Enterobacter asburiae]ELC6519412.1 helix-turn-helix transcriptional regulator [Enterobacter hormaechei]ELE9750646.1 helix-turn-helix transcriptional regulator [Enterobacter kobei]
MKTETPDIFELRRLKLQELVARFKTQREFAEKAGLDPTVVSRMLYPAGKANKRNIGEQSARQIEEALQISRGWMDGLGQGASSNVDISITSSDTYRVEVLDLTVSAGPGTFMISEYVEVLHAIEFTTEHARSLFGNRAEGDVKVMTVDGDSMAPTIKSGDRLFFDVSVRNFRVDGVYAFVFGQHFHVKRLQMQGLQLAVLSDNPAYKDWYVTEENQDQLYIMGKALIHESIAYNKL